MTDTKRTHAAEKVQVDHRSAKSVLRGHPWVWRHAIQKAPKGLEVGAPVRVLDPKNAFVAHGLWDPVSPIAIRVYSRREGDHLDIDLLTLAAIRAIDGRDSLFDSTLSDSKSTDAYRLCNGEGDRLPGVVLDRYGGLVVARFDGEAILAWSDDLLASLWPHLANRGFTSLALRDAQRGAGRVRKAAARVRKAAGQQVPETVVVREHGMRMLVDIATGQKTGAFLDQRENRRRVRAMADGVRVLNLFSYSGGFSCAAALGGAAHVTSVDVAHAAHGTAYETFRLNGIDPTRHAFVTGDVFSYLESARRRGERFDLVISDPPSFAPNEKSLPKARNAYRRLHRACIGVVAPGGTLCAASCSSHVDADAFLDTLGDDVAGGRSFQVLACFGQPADHPTVPGWPEGRYLKFVVLREQGPPNTALPLRHGRVRRAG